MRSTRFLVLTLCLLLPVLLPAQGQTTGAFAGKVTDVDGNPIPGAEITFVHVPTGTKGMTLTRASGRFDVPGVRAGGPYTITASHDDFKPETAENLVVKVGEVKEVNFVLHKAQTR